MGTDGCHLRCFAGKGVGGGVADEVNRGHEASVDVRRRSMCFDLVHAIAEVKSAALRVCRPLGRSEPEPQVKIIAGSSVAVVAISTLQSVNDVSTVGEDGGVAACYVGAELLEEGGEGEQLGSRHGLPSAFQRR